MAVVLLSPDQIDLSAQEAFDAYIDSLGDDGRLPRVHKVTEDMIARAIEVEDILGQQGEAFRCVVHEEAAKPTLCPACALERCQRGGA